MSAIGASAGISAIGSAGALGGTVDATATTGPLGAPASAPSQFFYDDADMASAVVSEVTAGPTNHMLDPDSWRILDQLARAAKSQNQQLDAGEAPAGGPVDPSVGIGGSAGVGSLIQSFADDFQRTTAVV